MNGKVALITASSTGIGKGIALKLAKEGVTVIISSRSQKNIDQTVNQIKEKGGKAIGIPCHVGKPEDREKLIKAVVAKFNKIDYLICNAAVSTHMGNFLGASEEQLQKMFHINYISTFMLIKECVPHLIPNKSSIVVVASYAAYELSSIIGHYSITKTALVALTKLVSRQLLDDGIRVNCVCPGLIKTKFSDALWSNGEQKAAETMGVKRLGVPQDIAGVVRFLLSDESSYMNGQSVVVAGRGSPRL